MMRFDWQARDLRLGAGFAAVTLVVMGLAQFREATWMTAGLSALLAWLPLLLLNHRHLRSGVAALGFYLLAGALLTILAHMVLPYEIGRICAVGVVAFAAGLMLRFGIFWYLFGYVLVFWYVLSPLFSGQIGLADTMEGHIVGTVGIALFWVCRRVWAEGATWDAPEPATATVPSGIMWRYAGVLSAVTMVGTGIGGRILSADPTLMTQASLNIIAPSMDMTLEAGAVRVVFGVGGLLIGFYLGLLFPSLVLYQFVIALCAFVALGFFKVNIGFLTGAFAVMFAFPIGMTGGEAAHTIGNERLFAEILGIALACMAIYALGRATPDQK